MIRKPAVAGYFYPGSERELRAMFKQMVDLKAAKEKALAVVSPHAGFVYSGYVAGAVFSSVVLPDHYIILGPSHQGIRPLFAIMTEGAWQTPLGEVPIASGLAEAVRKRTPLIQVDENGHRREHSLEVQLPFLQYLKKNISLVPICISYLADYRDLEELARAVAAGIREFGEDTLIVASTDMSHYVSQEVAKQKDFLAIEKIKGRPEWEQVPESMREPLFFPLTSRAYAGFDHICPGRAFEKHFSGSTEPAPHENGLTRRSPPGTRGRHFENRPQEHPFEKNSRRHLRDHREASLPRHAGALCLFPRRGHTGPG